MAIVSNNPFVKGLRGMLGGTLVFRTLRGKTVVSSRPYAVNRQSALQGLNRSLFKAAAAFAHTVLRDPAQREYYQQKAMKLKLPNAYTAAITDYMRKPDIRKELRKDGGMQISVRKKDFSVKRVKVVMTNTQGATMEREATWCAPFHVLRLLPEETGDDVQRMLIVEDHVGHAYRV